jgi:hypothetical protein
VENIWQATAAVLMGWFGWHILSSIQEHMRNVRVIKCILQYEFIQNHGELKLLDALNSVRPNNADK